MTLSVLDTQASILLIQTLPLFSSCRQNGTCFLEGGRGREPGSKRGVKGAGGETTGSGVSSQSDGNRREIEENFCNVT